MTTHREYAQNELVRYAGRDSLLRAQVHAVLALEEAVRDLGVLLERRLTEVIPVEAVPGLFDLPEQP